MECPAFKDLNTATSSYGNYINEKQTSEMQQAIERNLLEQGCAKTSCAFFK